MLDGERYYASFPDENPAGPSSELVSRVLLNTLVAFERQRCVSEKAPVEDVELRRVLGCWLKGLREARGLSQRELAKKVGVEHYTIISQLESGFGRMPPGGHVVWANALGVTPWEFAGKLMRSYDPAIYRLLFDKECCKEKAQSL